MPRPREPAHLFLRPDSKGGRLPGWYAYVDRDQRRVNLHTTDEAEAQHHLAALVTERGRVPAAGARELLLSEAADLTYERALTANTRKTATEIGLNLARIVKWCEQRDVRTVGAVNVTVVEDYKSARRLQVGQRTKRKIGAARVNRELDSWKRLMLTARAEKNVGHPGAGEWFTHLREPRPEPHRTVPGKRTVDKVLAKAAAGYRDLFRLVIGACLRDDEVRHMSPGDVRKGLVEVQPKPPGFCECCPNGWTSKSYRYRKITATTTTVAAARRFMAARPGMQLDQKRVWLELDKACELAKVPHMSLHRLRHAGATAWLDAGVPVKQISAWLGHRDLQTTERYLGIADDAKIDARSLTW